MKKMLASLLALVLCLSCCSCGKHPADTIDYNDDMTEMYYNGHTYIPYGDKFTVDVSDWPVVCVWSPLAYKTVFYGNDAEHPELIYRSRSGTLSMREDVCLNNDTPLSVWDLGTPYTFTVSQITTGESIEYEYDFYEVCNFYVSIEEYPYVRLWLTVSKYEGNYYIQDSWDADYYRLTDEFVEDLYRLSLDELDYKFHGFF